MIVEYKTILRGTYKKIGEKPIGYNDVWSPNTTKYKIMGYRNRCDEMKLLIDEVYGVTPYPVEKFIEIDIQDRAFCMDIKCCPFCGKRIKFEEVEKVKLNRVEKEIKRVEIDYIEELV